MGRLDKEKLKVTYLGDVSPDKLKVPRRYTLTHSDFTGRLFLSIGPEYDIHQTSKIYTRLMRDEVLAELAGNSENLAFHVYCHVSGGFVFGMAGWRYTIFRSELPLALEAIRYGDGSLFENNPSLDEIPLYVHFQSPNVRFNKSESWGTMSKFKC